MVSLFILQYNAADLFKDACRKKPLKICNGLLLTITVVCAVIIVVDVIVTYSYVRKGSTTFLVTTAFNTTIIAPLKLFIKTYTIKSNHDQDSCTLGVVTLPCSTLNKSYMKNQTSHSIENLNERFYIYLLGGSVLHFNYSVSQSIDCPSYTLWIFSSMEYHFNPDSVVSKTTECTPSNEQKFNGKCKIFSGSGMFDYQVPEDSFYYYVGYNCDYSRLSWTVDYYWYNFTQYANHSGVQTVSIPPGQHQEVKVSNPFSLSRTCILIHTPSTAMCRENFESTVTIFDVMVYPKLWLVCILPLSFVSFVGFLLALLGYLCCCAKEIIKVKREYAHPMQERC